MGLSGWRIISHHDEGLPTLLLQTRLEASGYTIQVTDLAYVWRESLDKPAILERAKELGCSIDPSQDAKQFKIFSDKLEAAFNQERDTLLQLKSRRIGSDITLAMSVKLPAPLLAFEWEAQLQRKDGFVASELSMPLVRYSRTLQQQVKDLAKELRAKDHVISRLTDRLETSGTPLSEVFPNVANIGGGRSKAMSNARIAQHVPGLRAFDEQQWLERFDAPENANFAHGLAEVLPKIPSGDESTTSPIDGWWRGLDTTIVGEQRSGEPSPTVAQEEIAEVDESTVFEAQELDEVKDHSYDDSDRTLSARSTTQHKGDKVMNSPLRANGKIESRKFGVIGGRKPVVEQRKPTPDPYPDNGSDTSHISETQLQSPKGRRKLGVIGKRTSRVDDQEPSTERLTSADIPTATNQAKKLGVIGGRKSDTTDKVGTPKLPEIQHGATTADVVSIKASERPEKTEEEEAIDKRAALKCELERKAQTPVKRRRKF